MGNYHVTRFAEPYPLCSAPRRRASRIAPVGRSALARRFRSPGEVKAWTARRRRPATRCVNRTVAGGRAMVALTMRHRVRSAPGVPPRTAPDRASATAGTIRSVPVMADGAGSPVATPKRRRRPAAPLRAARRPAPHYSSGLPRLLWPAKVDIRVRRPPPWSRPRRGERSEAAPRCCHRSRRNRRARWPA